MTPQPNFTDHSAEAKAVREALANFLARHTVALVFEGQPKLGTGILVSSGDALFVATARHVAEDLPIGDVFCIPKPPGPMRVAPRDEAMRHFEETRPGERFLLHVGDRILSTTLATTRVPVPRLEAKRDLRAYQTLLTSMGEEVPS